jgi:DNA-binding CsgD family transcriptional regulator
MRRAGRTQASSLRPPLPSAGEVAGVSPLTASALRSALNFSMGITTKVVSDLEERLARARLITDALDAQRRTALQELRESLRQLRELGSTMTQLRRTDGHTSPDPIGAGPRENGAGVFGVAERYGLSLRELEVALLISQGFSNREIAETVRVSTHTARHHTQHVLGKLGVRSRSRAAALINDCLGDGRPGK